MMSFFFPSLFAVRGDSEGSDQLTWYSMDASHSSSSFLHYLFQGNIALQISMELKNEKNSFQLSLYFGCVTRNWTRVFVAIDFIF